MKAFLVSLLVMCIAFSGISVSALGDSAKAAAVINGDTGEVIFSKNGDECLPMASTTKIMTALILAEQNTPEKEIVTTKEMVTVEGSSMGLLAGDTVSHKALLYGMLLASGNDAANTTAISISGSIEGFVKRMNRRARELGLKNTSFKTPSGLDAEGHYTTALDLAALARAALNNEQFAEAAASKSAVLYYGNPPYRRSLSNHNKLLQGFEGAVGVKTGFTKKSGRCLVSAARRDGRFVIAVTLNDPNDWQDHKNMLEYGLSEVRLVRLKESETKGSITVVGGNKDELSFDCDTLELGVCAEGDITSNVMLPDFLYAPVKKGQRIGRVEYFINGELLCDAEIKACEDVDIIKNDRIGSFFDAVKYILSMI